MTKITQQTPNAKHNLQNPNLMNLRKLFFKPACTHTSLYLTLFTEREIDLISRVFPGCRIFRSAAIPGQLG